MHQFYRSLPHLSMAMNITRLSSKGQIIIPKSIRDAQGWAPGLELEVIATSEGLLLKPRAQFRPTRVADVAGCLRNKIKPLTDEEIRAALQRDIKSRWHDRH